MTLNIIELSKRVSTINHLHGSISILQMQLDKMRQENEEELKSVSNEISHLNAIITEKNSLIEKLKSEGHHETEKQVFEIGLTLQSTEISDCTYEGLFDYSFDINAILYDSSLKDCSRNPSPREGNILDKGKAGNLLKSMTFTKKASNPNDITELDCCDYLKSQSRRTTTHDVMTQKNDETSTVSNIQDIPDTMASEKSSKDTVSESTIDRDLIKKLEIELQEFRKMAEQLKVKCEEKECIIESLYKSMKSLADENSKIIDDLNHELEKARCLIRKLKSE